MAEYYVAKTGNDTTGDGSEGLPWLTIQKSLNEVAAGDTVYVKTGTYVEALEMQTPGTIGNVITIKNFGTDEPLLTGTGAPEEKGIYWDHDGVQRDYIEWIGIDVSNFTRQGIWVAGAHCAVLKCEVFDNGHTGILTKLADHCIVNYCVVHDNGWNGIDIESSHYSEVQFNIVYNNIYHNGINMFPQPGSGGATQIGNNVKNNFVFNNAHGIYTRYQTDNEISNNLIYKNLDAGIFFHYESGESTAYASNTKVYNNTIADNVWEGIVSQGTIDNITIKNNILSNNDLIMTGTGHDIDYNLYHNSTYANKGPNSVTADPLFTDAAGDDYSLLSESSPAYNAGVDLTSEGITTDIIKLFRPNSAAFDIGAYEYKLDRIKFLAKETDMLHEISPALVAVGDYNGKTMRKGNWNLLMLGTFVGTVKVLKRLGGYDGFATQDGGDAQALLTDSGLTGIVADQLIGLWVRNRTDDSFAPITDNTISTVIGTLIGGTEAKWDNGDIADIYQEVASYTSAQDVEIEAYAEDTQYVFLCSAFTSGVINLEPNQ